MNLERSIDNLAKRLERFDHVTGCSNKIGLGHWKGKPIIPLVEWIDLRNTPHALNYFPDDFDQGLTYILEDEAGRGPDEVRKWDSDYQELM